METLEVRLPIQLGQFVKLANLAENGAHARELIQNGDISVNGEVETRRSHNLRAGDIVALDDGVDFIEIEVRPR